jgi:hypothetical protein
METLPEITDFPLSGLTISKNPFPHFSINEALSELMAGTLLSWFEVTDLWSFVKTNFYTQYEFSLVGLNLPPSLTYLNSEPALAILSDRFEAVFNKKLRVVDITAHKLVDGHKMGVHNDFIGYDESHRLVIQVNNSWKDENGGYLMLFNSKSVQDVSKVVRPLHNSAIGFEISENSFHAVSTVYDFTRYTLVYTFNEV